MTRKFARRWLATVAAGVALVLSTGATGSGCGASSTTGSGTAKPACSPTATVFCWRGDTVYVEDHTDDRFPVDRYVTAWDHAVKLRLVYGRCRDGAGCARIYVKNMGDNGEAGRTEIGTEYSTGVRGTTTYLNDLYARDVVELDPSQASGWLAEVVCHELGHVAGIRGHNDNDPASCMRTTIETDGGRTHVAASDATKINARYH